MTSSTKKNRAVPESADGMRLNRYIARSGKASRRKCEEDIQNGMVTVNGKLVTSPGVTVSAGDIVLWDGAAITLPDLFVAAMNKPSGYETTMDTDSTRPVTLLSHGMPDGSAPVGRLDIRTGGLLLWSNDGELIYRLTHPKWKIEREYSLVLATGVSREMIERLTKGCFIEPRVYSKPLTVKQTGAKKLSLVLQTGRNREVRRLAKVCGVPLIGLERVRYGSVHLEELERGSWRPLSSQEIEALCKLVKLQR